MSQLLLSLTLPKVTTKKASMKLQPYELLGTSVVGPVLMNLHIPNEAEQMLSIKVAKNQGSSVGTNDTIPQFLIAQF